MTDSAAAKRRLAALALRVQAARLRDDAGERRAALTELRALFPLWRAEWAGLVIDDRLRAECEGLPRENAVPAGGV